MCYLENTWVEKSISVLSIMTDSSAASLGQNSDLVQVSGALWGTWAPPQAQGDSPLVTGASHSSSPVAVTRSGMSTQAALASRLQEEGSRGVFRQRLYSFLKRAM